MRLLDLTDLFEGEGEAPVDLDRPVVLPGALSPGDQDEVIALVRSRSAPRPLRVVDVRWDGGLTEPARRAALAAASGGPEALLVVRATPTSDVEAVLRDDAVARHRRVVVAVEHPGGGEPFGPARELVRRAVDRADGALAALAAPMSLGLRPWRALRAQAVTLSNPAAVAVLCDAALALQLEGLSGDALHAVALRRVLLRELAWRGDAEVAALACVAEHGAERAARDHPDAMAALRAQMLVRDGRLLDWAALLHEPAVADEALDALARERAAVPPLRDVLRRRVDRNEKFDGDIRDALRMIRRGEYAEATRLLDERVGVAASRPLPPAERWMAWLARGLLERALGRPERAVAAFETAAELVSPLGVLDRALVRQELGETLVESGDVARGAHHLTAALALNRDAGTPRDVAIAAARLARALARLGDNHRALDALNEALAVESRNELPADFVVAMLADRAVLLHRLDRLDESLTATRELLPLAPPTLRNVSYALHAYSLGVSLAKAERWVDAAEMFRAARDRFHATPDHAVRAAWCAYHLAHAAQRSAPDAPDTAEAIGAATEMIAALNPPPVDLQQAVAMLRLPAPRPPSVPA